MRKKFISGLKHAEQNLFYICVDVCQIYDGKDHERIFEVLSTLMKKKRKKNILIEKYKDMIKHPDFHQNYYSRTSVGVYKIGYENLRLMK